jgi:AbrB family looped-hinge helix DNA binding protein
MAVKVSSKGQITLPKRIRDLLDLKPGSVVDFRIGEDGVRIEHIPEKQAQALAGSLSKYSKKRRISDTKVLEEVKEEVAREAAHEGLRSGH